MTTCPVGCGRESDGMCGICWSGLSANLGAVEWLVIELDTTMSRQAKIGGASIGVVTRTAERPLPINLAASDTAHQLRNTLTTWVRLLHVEHAVRWQQCTECSTTWTSGLKIHNREDCDGGWDHITDPLVLDDTAVELAKWLLRHPSWIRAHTAAGDLHRALMCAIDASWRGIDRPPDKIYLGICSAEVEGPDGPDNCLVDLFAADGQRIIRCWACTTVHVVEDRRRVLTTAVEDQIVPVGVLVGLVGALGQRVTTDAIAGFKRRGRLHPKVTGEDGSLRLRTPDDPAGPDLYRVGDVLDVISRKWSRDVA